jgi:uncharacterized membrane protein YkoI
MKQARIIMPILAALLLALPAAAQTAKKTPPPPPKLTEAEEEGNEQKVQLAELPAAVQRAVNEHSKGINATLVGYSKEVKAGKTLYEAEMKVNGRTRDVTFDQAGKLVSVEQEVLLDSIPAAARAAIQEAASGGKIELVESINETGKPTLYEAHIRKGEKEIEVKVDAAGRPVKD